MYDSYACTVCWNQIYEVVNSPIKTPCCFRNLIVQLLKVISVQIYFYIELCQFLTVKTMPDDHYKYSTWFPNCIYKLFVKHIGFLKLRRIPFRNLFVEDQKLR